MKEVSARRPVPLDCSKKFVGNGRLCAQACSMSSGGKRIPRDGEVGAAMCPLASVYTSIAESGTGGSGSTKARGEHKCLQSMLLPKGGLGAHLVVQGRCVFFYPRR